MRAAGAMISSTAGSHPEATREERRLAHLRGIMRTQVVTLIDKGLVRW